MLEKNYLKLKKVMFEWVETIGFDKSVYTSAEAVYTIHRIKYLSKMLFLKLYYAAFFHVYLFTNNPPLLPFSALRFKKFLIVLK